MMLPSNPGPIGIFDSGYGGLTILHGLRQLLPQYDYMYLGDNARAPYKGRVGGKQKQVAIRHRLKPCVPSSRGIFRNWIRIVACWVLSDQQPR